MDSQQVDDDPEANPPITQPTNPAPRKCSPSSIFILCFVLILSTLPLIYACFLIVALATLPLLLTSLIIVRIFQFIKYGKSYKKLTYFKNFIRGWLYINVMMVLVGLWIFFPIAKYVPSLNQVLVLDLPFTKWVVIISIVCGFYLLSYLIYSLTHGLTPMLNVRSLNFPQAFSEIIDGIIIWWAEHEVMKRVPAFRKHEMLGLPTRRWIRVSILVLIGYNLITLFTYVTVLSLRKICQKRPKSQSPNEAESGFWHKLLGKHLHKKYVVYFANGMKLSINFIMSSFLLLGTWVSYFGSRLDMNSAESKRIWEFGVWTFLSLLICSFLWLIKTFVLLAWEIHTVYHRLERRILPISEQLYFLGVLGCRNHDILKLAPKTSEDAQQSSSPSIFEAMLNCLYPLQNLSRRIASISEEFRETLNIRKWERITNHLLIPKDPTMDDLQRAIKYFKGAKKHLLKETYISDILTPYYPTADYWKNLDNVMANHHVELKTQGTSFMSLFNINQTPREEQGEGVTNPSSQTNPSHFNDDQKTWVKRAHNQCKLLANTLGSANEFGGCLDKIISCLLIAATLLIWLLLTGLATTKVLVLITSPLLAATFIFGSSCKTLFEGIIFVFVVHPLDVGDLCVIDDTMLEVIAIGIWTTTFTTVEKLGSQEVVRHPNLDLAKKVIISHKTKFDWTDCLVYVLGDLNTIRINNQNDIINFFKNQLKNKEFKRLSSSQKLTVSVTEDESNTQIIKLVICLEYMAADDTSFWTYSESLRQRDELKADFCLLMRNAISTFKAQYGS